MEECPHNSIAHHFHSVLLHFLPDGLFTHMLWNKLYDGFQRHLRVIGCVGKPLCCGFVYLSYFSI